MEVPEDVFLDELTFYQLGDEVIQAFRQKEGILGEPVDVDCLYLLADDSWQKKVHIIHIIHIIDVKIVEEIKKKIELILIFNGNSFI